MYTIKEAASRAGLSVPVLRAWERRYGIVSPARTASGYRLYDDAAIARVRAMRRLVETGMAPSTAAAAIKAGRSAAPESVPDPTGSDVIALSPLADRFVAAAEVMDESEVEDVLDAIFATGSFEHAVDGYLLPALEALGEAWADGRVDVAAEHAASHAVLRRLSAAFQAAGRPADGAGAILVGLPPGARHELGGLAFATAARRAGLPVVYLGADLPVRDWLAAATRTQARAAVIGVVTASDREPAERVASELLAADPGLVVAFGGRSVPVNARPTEARDATGAPSRLPIGLAAGVEALQHALRASRR
jgi:MerR family transcriptional regulator, light-induced transcriptional regulator